MTNRFVILRHEFDDDTLNHWDLMLEEASELWTWRLPVLPAEAKQQSVERIKNHRVDYLDYEGVVSGERGRVVRVENGFFKRVRWSGELIEIEISGQRYNGRLRLTRLHDHLWSLLFSVV